MRDNRALISGQPTYYSGLDDLSAKSDGEKVDWFLGRFAKIIIGPLREVRALGPANERIRDLNLGVVTIICSAIEALGCGFGAGWRMGFQSKVTKWQRDRPSTFRTRMARSALISGLGKA
jgi:hypothetical protein